MSDIKPTAWTQLGVPFFIRPYGKRKSYAVFQCECGRIEALAVTAVASGRSARCRSCASTKHGLSESAEFSVWGGMLDRCTNPNTAHFEHYGGRGIKVCERWLTFENFYADMGPRPSPRHTIDRKDTNGDYEPDNCQWLERDKQSRNRRCNLYLTIDGVTKLAKEWCADRGISVQTYWSRLKKSGMDPYDALYVGDMRRQMSEELCVCGHDHIWPPDTGITQPHSIMCQTDGCNCLAFRPALDWPDSEGWWWEHSTTGRPTITEIVYVIENDGELVIWSGDNYLSQNDDWVSMSTPRYVKLLEQSPFPNQ